MNKPLTELRQIAGYLEIPGRSKMNKAELVDAIQQQTQQRAGNHNLSQRVQRGAGSVGAPFANQTGGNPTGMPWQWYNP